MANAVLITGPAGSGKTYAAIERARATGKRLVYAAPCRQLAYETALAHSDDPSIRTGEYGRQGDPHSLFCVFESLHRENLDDAALVIDEAHFLTDWERGAAVYDAASRGAHVFLATATNNIAFGDGAVKSVDLPAREHYTTRQIDAATFYRRLADEVSSIEFHRSVRNAEVAAQQWGGEAITGYSLPHERLRSQMQFAAGRLNYVAATNVLAQGLNFPCENLMVESSFYNSPELIAQKIGRLGRPGKTRKGALLTYCLSGAARPKSFAPRPIVRRSPANWLPVLIRQKNAGSAPALTGIVVRDHEYIEDADIQQAFDLAVRRRDVRAFYRDYRYRIPTLQKLVSEVRAEQEDEIREILAIYKKQVVEPMHRLIECELQVRRRRVDPGP